MGRKSKEGVFTFVFQHVKGELLLNQNHTVDDSGNPILKRRLYAYKINRAFKSIYLNPRKK